MDETLLRQQLTNAAHQLWMRGLIIADGGLVTAEAHRRRYLVTPPGRRRCDLAEGDIRLFDIGGIGVNGEPVLEEPLWRAHRVAYQLGIERHLNNGYSGGPHASKPTAIHATVLATPPMTLAMLRLQPTLTELQLTGVPGLPPVPVVSELSEADIRAALERSSAIALGRDNGLLCVAPDVWGAVNLLERIEHAATIELACRHGL